MRIEVLDYVDNAAQHLNEHRDEYKAAAKKALAYFDNMFRDTGDITNITYRIKTEESLREKILRNNLYGRYAKDELFDNLSDVIGIRIGCRFLADEKSVYEKIKNTFCLSFDGEYFHPTDDETVFLKLDSAQPEKQRNGFQIYRIDGHVLDGDKKLRFELQLKSLINGFWSEVEHRIIYKNKRAQIEGFMGELMNSIYKSLENIDSQLNMLYHRGTDSANTEFETQTENVLTAIVNELFVRVTERHTGISLNFTDYAECLVNYVVHFSSFADYNASLYGGRGGVTEAVYGRVIINLMDRIKDIDFTTVNVGEEITLQGKIKYSNDLEAYIGKRLKEVMNKDFHINTFFHLLFSIEKGSNEQDFLSFVKYYALKITGGGKVADYDAAIEVFKNLPVESMLSEEMILETEKLVRQKNSKNNGK